MLWFNNTPTFPRWANENKIISLCLPSSFPSFPLSLPPTLSLPLPPLSSQALGAVLIGVGAWLEVQEQTIVEVVNQQVFLAGPYLLIAAGCFIVIIAVIGMIGAFCDSKINRFLLLLVSLTVILNACTYIMSYNYTLSWVGCLPCTCLYSIDGILIVFEM